MPRWDLQSILGRRRTVRVDAAVIEVHQKFREAADVAYKDSNHSLTFPAEWLGWGKGQEVYLAVSLPHSDHETMKALTNDELQLIAKRLSSGLQALSIKHAVIQLSKPIPISKEECEEGLRSYQNWMRSRGWSVTFDKDKLTMRQERIPNTENLLAEGASAEIVAKKLLQAKQWLSCFRIDPHILFQSEGIVHPTSFD